MAASQNFRSAFNGFNREDVVHYLEYLNAKHTNQINQLTAENEALRAQVDTLPELESQQLLVASLEEKCAELTRLLEAAQARCEELEQAAARAPAEAAPLPAVWRGACRECTPVRTAQPRQRRRG